MMRHGFLGLALWGWLVAGAFAADAGIPASTGMPGGGLEVLPPEGWDSVIGGDLYLSVDRDTQMMTVTRVTPGDYGNTEAYTVKVTTSVVRDSDTKSVAKGAMQNTARELSSKDSALVPAGETRTPTQFPSGTAKLAPTTGTQATVTGPVIRTNATQSVAGKDGNGTAGLFADAGYNIHYVDPAKASNTLGCIGVQSLDNMNKLAATLATDTKSYPSPTQAKQVVTVSAYTSGVPVASTFKPATAPAKVAATPVAVVASTAPVVKAWWQFW